MGTECSIIRQLEQLHGAMIQAFLQNTPIIKCFAAVPQLNGKKTVSPRKILWFFVFCKIFKKIEGKCGICGEDYSAPKLWERGGRNYVGRSVRTYTQGQVIDVYVQVGESNIKLDKIRFIIFYFQNQKLTAEHLGYFEFRICNVDGWNKEATQECLDQTILKDQAGKSKFYVNLSFKYYYKLVLPAGLKCNHCVFQVIRIMFA